MLRTLPVASACAPARTLLLAVAAAWLAALPSCTQPATAPAAPATPAAPGASTAAAAPSAATAPAAGDPSGDEAFRPEELLAGHGLEDGAPTWTLEGASLTEDMGLAGRPAFALRVGESGAARVTTRLVPAPAGRTLEFSAVVQGLEEGRSVVLRVRSRDASGELLRSSDRTIRLPFDTWRRGLFEIEVPPGAAELELEVGMTVKGTALVCEPSLRPVLEFPDLSGDLSKLSAATLGRAAAVIERRVEQLRGRVFEKPVPVRVVAPSEARAFFEGRVLRDYPRERAELDRIAYVQLGLWPAELDMIETVLDLLEEQAGGFYDPDTDTFYLVSSMPGSIASILMAHELTHALDDQLHDIDGGLADVRGESDTATAYASVVEGSGTSVMNVFTGEEFQAGRLRLADMAEFQKSEAGKAEILTRVPPVLSRGLMAPYLMGQHFLSKGGLPVEKGLGERIDRAFVRPPTSTEQILHPAKYWDAAEADPPVRVRPPDLSSVLGDGWSRVHEDTLGELVLAVLTGSGVPGGNPNTLQGGLATLSPSSWTSFAVAGWGGDRVQLYAGADGRHVTLLSTVWDSEKDAAEFEGGLVLPEGVLVQRDGARVVVVAGTAGDAAPALARAALDAPVAGP